MKRYYKMIASLCMCLVITSCGAEQSDTDNQGANRQQIQSEEEAVNYPEKRESHTKASDKKQPSRQKERKKKQEPTADAMVKVLDYIPDVEIDLRYSTKNNFTGQKVYDFKEAYMRYGTVKKLKRVQKRLKRKNYTLLIWDAYRPVSAQYKLWEICPDPVYVANPNKGYSSHSRGNTVDITILTDKGEDVKMPTDFDDFTKKADRNYSDCSREERENAKMLENLMKDEGFIPYAGEWWHFSDTRKYPVKKSLKKVK